MSDDPADGIPAHLRKFLPEREPGPTLAERFDAYLAAHAPDDESEAERWRVRSRSEPEARTWKGVALTFGMLAALFIALGWKVFR